MRVYLNNKAVCIELIIYNFGDYIRLIGKIDVYL
mgnify:FL=1